MKRKKTLSSILFALLKKDIVFLKQTDKFEKNFPSSSPENFQQSLNIMMGCFMRKDPLKSNKLHEHPKVVALFTRENQMPFFERIHGYDEEVTEEFLMSLRPH